MPCLPTSALRVAFQVTKGSVMAITPPSHSKHDSEASSANTCPLTCVSSNGGLVNAHHPSLSHSVAQHTLPHSKCKSEGCSSPIYPLSCISSYRGLCSCPPRPPSLEMRVGGSILRPPARHLAFRATEGSVYAQHAQHTLPHSKHKLAGPFCPHHPIPHPSIANARRRGIHIHIRCNEGEYPSHHVE